MRAAQAGAHRIVKAWLTFSKMKKLEEGKKDIACVNDEIENKTAEDPAIFYGISIVPLRPCGVLCCESS
jgi:hypothetical protein